MAKKADVSGSMKVKITRDLLTDALVWHCPRYVRDGACSRCDNLDGTYSNCVKSLCSQVHDIFKTMVKIKNGEITVW
jgi:hypothetical protein